MEHNGHIIELSDAVALLGDFPALAGVDLSVSKGEVVAIEGPNGAGKSTLLRLCAGLLPLHTGTGVVLGNDLASRDQRRQLRRQSGLLAHETFLYDELSVIDNITFWAKANRSDISTIEPVLDRLGLDGRLREVKARDLSAGQRRRTSLAIMISRRPHIWLLDEPHAALDEKGKDAVDSLVKQAVGFGATVLIASHDHQRARLVANRVVQVAGGRIVGPASSEQPSLSAGESGTYFDEELTQPVTKMSALPGRPITKGFVNSPTIGNRDEAGAEIDRTFVTGNLGDDETDHGAEPIDELFGDLLTGGTQSSISRDHDHRGDNG